jgi:hypothetical protein
MTKVSKEDVSLDWENGNGWNYFLRKEGSLQTGSVRFYGTLPHSKPSQQQGGKIRVNGGLQLSVCETLALLFSFLFFLYWVVSFQGWLFVFFFDFAFITTARCCAFSLLLSSLPFCEDKFGFF